MDYCFIATVNWSSGIKEKGRKNCTSIVQITVLHSIYGQRLGLTVHTHGEFLIHLSWNAGPRTGSYENCIARHTKQSAVWYDIINQIRWGGLRRLCRCVFGTVTGYDSRTIKEVCFYTYLKEEIGVEFYCRCQAKFSLEIGENYKRSIFLEDGRMLLF